ncbi:MAG: gamma-butyrobetaine hydroxylase-like domain-containing protein [Pseudomonadota bacterium]|nr:gamma-butyrobetaine hydroxylase-like domain-containing protein [Pseudomonadota bacterium]
MTPTEIKLSRDKSKIIISWPDGDKVELSALLLRQRCNSASSKRSRIDGAEELKTEHLTIAEIRSVGLYAINLVFSDGHDRGIYPWSYLRELCYERLMRGVAEKACERALSIG